MKEFIVVPNFPNSIRALSIAGSYAYLIAIGEKQSECRSWKTNFRSIVLLHVSTGREYGEPQRKEIVSAIIGAAEVYDCTPNLEHTNSYNHWMRNAVLFKQFIPGISGKRNYWMPKTSAHIEAFNCAWSQIQEQAPYLIEKQTPTEISPRILITPPPRTCS